MVFEGQTGTSFKSAYCPSRHTWRENFPLVRCKNCGLVYAWPRPQRDAVEDYYKQYTDTAYEEEAESRRKIARKQLQWLEKSGQISPGKSPQRLLEIGAATGIFLAEAHARGYEVTGIEPSQWARQTALQKYGLALRDGDIWTQHFPPSSFEIICLFDVIEHLDDPRATVVEVARILSPNGWVVLLTPDIGHWRARLMGKRWWGIQESHLSYFSRKTITKLLALGGLRVVTIGAGPRVFSLEYWARQCSGYSRSLGALLRAISRGSIGRWKIGMKFPDHMMVLAKKESP